MVCDQAINEQKLIQSIRSHLKQENLILRRMADQTNVFYLMNKNLFEEKCQDYMKQTEDHYEILYTLNENNQQEIRFQLDQKIQTYNKELETLLKGNKNTEKIYRQLNMKLDEMKLSYLYFLPDLSSVNNILLVKPMFSSYQNLTWKLGNYLYRLLQPFICDVMKRTMVFNDNDFMNKLYQYCHRDKGLYPFTIFASIQVTNFPRTFSAEHEHISNLLDYFINQNRQLYKPSAISISTIKQLVDLFVQNNFFYYDQKIYRLRKGAPNSMLFTELLSNVHIFLWQKEVFDDARLKTTFFVRYQDQIFFAWNHSEHDLHTFLNQIKGRYQQTFQMNFMIGRSVHYLNVQIENRAGQLYTSVYHPHTLKIPYVVGHPKNKHAQWFRSALVRAVQLSTDYQDFNQERISLEISCLLNGYSIDFIEQELNKFYRYFEMKMHRFNMNQTIYDQLRRYIRTFIESQQRNEEKDKELDEQERLIRLHYLYDYGPYHQFKDKFTDIFSKSIQQTSTTTTTTKKKNPPIKIVLNAKHLFSLNTLLATEQKPSSYPFL